MMMQKRWVEILKPDLFSLKFKTDHRDKDFIYLAGDILIQPWVWPWSRETRLIGT